MGKRFSQLEKGKDLSANSHKIKELYAWIIIALVVLIGGGIFSYYAFFNNKVAKESGKVSGAEVNQNISQDNEESGNPVVNMLPEQKAQAEVRDQKRLEDIKRLQAVLLQYFKEKQSYPKELAELVPKYIEMIPVNPAPGGASYNYTPIGTAPYKFFDLSYTLEAGVEGLEPGMHFASPNGIAEP